MEPSMENWGWRVQSARKQHIPCCVYTGFDFIQDNPVGIRLLRQVFVVDMMSRGLHEQQDLEGVGEGSRRPRPDKGIDA